MFLWVQKRLKSVDSFPCHVFSVMFLKSPCEHAGSQMRHLGTGSWGGGVYVCGGWFSPWEAGLPKHPVSVSLLSSTVGAPAPLWTPTGSDSGKAPPSRWATAVHGVQRALQAGWPLATTGVLAWTT